VFTALPPTGFYEIAALSARAAFVSQKPVQAFCAATDSAWQSYIASIGGLPSGVTSAFGYTPTVGGESTLLAPATCATINSRLRKRRVSLPTLGAALDVVTVESLHMRGERDDGQTACDAIHALPSFLVAKWGFRKNSGAYSQVMYGARNYLARQPPQYHSAGC
jgi:hypothetical protein